ncbi:MAG: hypothetical protein KDA89_04335, partial [Planctomycetaceae bacterium]|nr:hypothetical protein [Planctomycetaceae bacterium]
NSTSGDIVIQEADDIVLNSISNVSGDVILTSQNGSMTDGNGAAVNITAINANLTALNGSIGGTSADVFKGIFDPIEVLLTGNLTATAAGAVAVDGTISGASNITATTGVIQTSGGLDVSAGTFSTRNLGLLVGGTLTLPGTLSVIGDLRIEAGDVTAADGSIDLTAGRLLFKSGAAESVGVAGTADVLAGNALAGQNQVTLTNAAIAATVQAGDRILLTDNDSAGEILTVASVSGTTLTLSGTLTDDFTTAQNASVTIIPRFDGESTGVGNDLTVNAVGDIEVLDLDCDVSTVNLSLNHGLIAAADGGVSVNANNGTVLISSRVSASDSGSVNIIADAGNRRSVIGIDVDSVVTTESGSLILNGTGGDVDSDNDGVRIRSGRTVSTSSGPISVTGFGGGDGAGASNQGVVVQGTVSSAGAAAGPIDINGTGGNGTGGLNRGVWISGAAINSVEGDILISGSGGLGIGSNNSVGVAIGNSSVVESTGTGTNAARITVLGGGGSGAAGMTGIVVSGQGLITSIDGDILLSGNGGTGTAASAVGILMDTDAVIRSTGTGVDSASVTLDGTGGSGTSSVNGIQLQDSGAGGGTTIESVVGDIALIGTAGVGSGIGITMGGVGNVRDISHGTAAITVDGTGGSSTDAQIGVQMTANSVVSSVDGDIVVNGTAGQGSGANNIGIEMRNGSAFLSLGTADIILSGMGSQFGTTLNHGIEVESGAAIRSTGNVRLESTGSAGDILIDSDISTLGVSATLTADSNSGAVNEIDITDASGFTIGDTILLTDNDSSFEEFTVTAVSGNTLTLSSAPSDVFEVTQQASVHRLGGSAHVTVDSTDDIVLSELIFTDTGTVSLLAANNTADSISGIQMPGGGTISTNDGNIRLAADNEGDIMLGRISAGTADVNLVAEGSILDNIDSNLSVAASGGSNTLTVNDGSGFAVGDIVTIDDADSATESHVITGVAGNTLTLATSLTDNFTSGSAVTVFNIQANALRMWADAVLNPAGTQNTGSAGDGNGTIGTPDALSSPDSNANAIDTVVSSLAAQSAGGIYIREADGLVIDQTGNITVQQVVSGTVVDVITDNTLSDLTTTA